MPFPVAAALAAGATLGGAAINAAATGKMNKKTRRWNEKMYARQRADALSDWAMQNEYNSPRAQMQRLQEANLNPHLIYGGGSGVTEAGGIRSTDVKSWSPEVPRLGDVAEAALDGALSIYDLKIKKAQVDNLTAQNTNLKMDTLIKGADIIGKTQSNETKSIDLQNKKELQDYAKNLWETNPEIRRFMNKDSLDVTRYNMTYQQEQELLQRIRHNEDKHPGNLAIQAQALKSMLEQVARSQQERKAIGERINQMLKDGRLKDLHIQMRENGIEPSDPQWQRLMIRAINGEGIIGRYIK